MTGFYLNMKQVIFLSIFMYPENLSLELLCVFPLCLCGSDLKRNVKCSFLNKQRGSVPLPGAAAAVMVGSGWC